MKPKTKRQKKVVSLSKRLKPVTRKQKEWAEQSLFGGYYVRSRNRNYCLECGHKWNPDLSKYMHRVVKPSCPGCGATSLTHADDWDRDRQLYDYWAKIEVCAGMQVVRMFRIGKYLKKKQPAEYSHMEVMQHWVDKKGTIESMSVGCATMGGYYYDQWTIGSALEVRTDSMLHRRRCSIEPSKIIPGRDVLPIMNRNGYRGHFYGHPPHQFFSAILKHSKAETLLKAGQIELFNLCVGHSGVHNLIENYWPSVCIAIRNDYTVEDALSWLDYLRMMDRLGKDVHNPVFVCPDDFEKAHAYAVKKTEELNEKERLEKLKDKIHEEDKEYKAKKAAFFGLKISAGDIEIVPLRSVREFYDEGKALKHCLFGMGYHKRDNSLVLSARKDGEPVENVEVDLKDFKIMQSRGLHNQPTELNEQIRTAVEQNMDKIARIATGEAA